MCRYEEGELKNTRIDLEYHLRSHDHETWLYSVIRRFLFSIKVTDRARLFGCAVRNVKIPSWKSCEAPWLHVTRWGAVCVIVWSNEVTFTAVKTNCAMCSHSIRLRMPHSLLCLPYLALLSLVKISLLFSIIFFIFSILLRRKGVVELQFHDFSICRVKILLFANNAFLVILKIKKI